MANSERTERIILGRFSEKHQKRIRRIKRKHRTDIEINDWSKQNHASRWEAIKQGLIEKSKLAPQKLDCCELTVEDFRTEFEAKREPCVISGCAESWSANKRWSIANLREQYGKIKFKCGEDDDGYSLKVKLETFARYQQEGACFDDSPLYVFDSSFDRTCPELLEDYKVPVYFPEDLFALVGEKRRPPYRWFLIGPERSGTTVHVDPLETSAWNTSIQGRKLWAMFSPEVPRAVVKGKQFMKPDGDDEAVDWFYHFLPRILKDLPENARFFQFIQYPGDTVFVPHGWWHAVINLDDTIAVTHNYVSSLNFYWAWKSVRVERKKMAQKWKAKLMEKRPELFKLLEAIDLEEPVFEHKKQEKKKKQKYVGD